MSVLFKALQRAEKARSDGAVGQPGYAAAASGGSTIASASSSGAGRRIVRGLGIVFVLILGASAAAMFLFKDDLGDLLVTAMGDTPARPAAPPMPVQVPAAPTQDVAATPAPAPALAVPAEDTAPDGTTNIAALMAAARAARGEADPTTPGEADPTAPGEAASDATGEPDAQPQATAPADGAPARPPQPMAVDDAIGKLGRAAEADTMRPPVTVERDGRRGGLPADTVEVAVPSLATRDGVAEGYRMLLRGDYNAALGVYETVLADDPANVQALLGRAASLHKLRRLEEARAAYEQVLGAEPGNREALTNLLAIVADDDPQDAVARLRELARQAPSFSPVVGQLGLLYGRMGATDAAIEELTRAAALDPGNLLYRYNLAVLLDRAGRRPEAVAAYRQVIEGLRTSPTALAVSPDALRARLQFLLSTG